MEVEANMRLLQSLHSKKCYINLKENFNFHIDPQNELRQQSAPPTGDRNKPWYIPSKKPGILPTPSFPYPRDSINEQARQVDSRPLPSRGRCAAGMTGYLLRRPPGGAADRLRQRRR